MVMFHFTDKKIELEKSYRTFELSNFAWAQCLFITMLFIHAFAYSYLLETFHMA